MIHSFLMIGQSNMAGRGFPKDVPLIYDEQIKMLRNGRWQTMVEPVNYDRPSSGVSLVSSFAAAWRLKNEQAEIGLIPCAEGGASLDDWTAGGPLFEHAVFQAKLARRSSKLEGILWHQGESDCFTERAAHYYEKFKVIVDALRRELNAPDIPLIIGGLGDYLTEGRYGSYFKPYPIVNQVLQEFAATQRDCYFVTASGLTANPDGIHLDAASQRTFGIRYFEAFDRLQNITTPITDENDLLQKIYERPLSKAGKVFLLENSFACGEMSLAELEMQLAIVSQE
jgi:hypothetical protein